MNEQEFWKEYQKILEEHRAGLTAKEKAEEGERRDHPRMKVPPKSLWSEDLPEAVVENISATGVALRATQPRQVGELLHVALGSAMSADVQVVACRMVHAPDMYIDGEFIIQCRYLEDLKGMEMVVKTIRNN